MTGGTFSVVNDQALCKAIEATTDTLVYVAPGISKPVVEALDKALGSHPSLLVTVIVDLDPEVYRLGYGTEEGLRELQALVRKHHLALRQQAGVRIGLLVTDNQTLVYSPTPLLIETGSTLEGKPNAIVITRAGDATASLMLACGAPGWPDQEAPAPKDAEIGQDAATPAQVDKSMQSLKETPPKRFDVARIERVYETKIQFVEIELTGYRLSSKRVNIPNDLLLGEDKGFKERLKNSFLLLQGEQTIVVEIPDLDPETLAPRQQDGKPVMVRWSEAELEKQRKALYDDFLINVPGFGQLIMRRNRPALDRRLSLLKAQVADFTEAVRATLGQELKSAIKELAETLLPRVRGDRIPARYARGIASADVSDADLLSLLEHDLRRTFGGGGELFKPELRWVFKDVTYESISDSKFKELLSKALRDSGGDRLVAQLFPEHDAAPESAVRPKTR